MMEHAFEYYDNLIERWRVYLWQLHPSRGAAGGVSLRLKRV